MTVKNKKRTPVKTIAQKPSQLSDQELKETMENAQQELEKREHTRNVQAMTPISDQELLTYVKNFLSDLQASAYEPWEFQSEDMPELLRMGIRNGIREEFRYGEDDPTKITDDAKELIELAAEARGLTLPKTGDQ